MKGKGGNGVTALQSWGDQDGLKTEQEPCKSICQTLIENVWVLLAPLWALCGSSVTHNQRPKELPDSSLREWSRSGRGTVQVGLICWSQPVQEQDYLAVTGWSLG